MVITGLFISQRITMANALLQYLVNGEIQYDDFWQMCVSMFELKLLNVSSRIYEKSSRNVCMYVCVRACVCVCACVRACVHACMHVCMYIYPVLITIVFYKINWCLLIHGLYLFHAISLITNEYIDQNPAAVVLCDNNWHSTRCNVNGRQTVETNFIHGHLRPMMLKL